MGQVVGYITVNGDSALQDGTENWQMIKLRIAQLAIDSIEGEAAI